MSYPKPKQISVELENHGVKRVDEYRWLQEKENPEVIAHIESENAYVADWTADTEELQQQLYREMRSRVVEANESLRTWHRHYAYFSRTFEGKEYAAYYRVDQEGNEECLLDGNAEAEGKPFWDLGDLEVSLSERLLAYSVDETGDEYYTIFVRDLESGKVLREIPKVTTSGLLFEKDEQSIIYVRADKTHRPYQVCRMNLETGAEEVLFEDLDERFFVGIDLSRDERTLYIQSGSKMTTKLWWREFEQPESDFVPVLEPKEGHRFDAVRYMDFWLIISNRDNKQNGQVWKLQPRKDFWTEAELLISEYPDYEFEGLDEFQDFAVIYRSGRASQEMDILDVNTWETHQVAFDSAAHSVGGYEVFDFDSPVVRFSYTNDIQPFQIWEYEVATGKRKLLKEYPVNGEYNPDDYVLEQRWYASHDGTKVPATIMYRKGTQFPAPTLQYGYGSYGIFYSPRFSSRILSLVDRGVVFVMSHIRGGGDLGKYWHYDGHMLKKKNTFEDFVAVTTGIQADGLTTPEQTVAMGGSAGGLLMGAVANMRPELYTSLIADVPFVDSLNTMLDDTLPLTVTEYEEWGNPNQPEYFEYMQSYAPYENVREGEKYPTILAIGGLHDPRVSYWEPTKWIARLRDRVTNPKDMLLKIYMSGHSGTTGRFEMLKEVAFRYAFVLKTLGLSETKE